MSQPQLTQEALAREAALPENLWIQCPYCKQGSYRESLGNAQVCPHCHYGFRITAKNDCHLSRQQQKNGMPIW